MQTRSDRAGREGEGNAHFSVAFEVKTDALAQVTDANSRQHCGEFEYEKCPNAGPGAARYDCNRLPEKQTSSAACRIS
jgi:hypothetical protein